MVTKLKLITGGGEVKEHNWSMVIKNPRKVQQMIQKARYGEESRQIDNAVEDIIERVGEIKEIEENILKMLNLVRDLHALVSAQN